MKKILAWAKGRLKRHLLNDLVFAVWAVNILLFVSFLTLFCYADGTLALHLFLPGYVKQRQLATETLTALSQGKPSASQVEKKLGGLPATSTLSFTHIDFDIHCPRPPSAIYKLAWQMKDAPGCLIGVSATLYFDRSDRLISWKADEPELGDTFL